MFDLVFLELGPLNLRVTFTDNVRRLPVSFDVGSTALSTSKDTGMGRRLFVKVIRKFNGHNSRKTRSNISGQETHIVGCG